MFYLDKFLSIFITVYRRVLLPGTRCLSQNTGSEHSERNTESNQSFDSGPELDPPEFSKEETEKEYQTKQCILKASLPFVHEYGWTKKALSAGADSEGFPGVAHGMFPRGGVELVFYFYRECNKNLVDHLETGVKKLQEQKEKIRTQPFISQAIETRLRMIIPYMDKWPQAMAIQTLPQNSWEAWSNLGKLVDNIWHYTGDKSTDFNWYTKRATLAGVYKSTEIFMLQDKSDDYEETWHFLNRRLDDLTSFSKFSKNAQEMGSVMSEGMVGACIMTWNILGMNNRWR